MPHEFEAQDGDIRQTGFPGIVRANGTTIPVAGYAFDATAEEALFFRFKASDYTAGAAVAVELDWYAVSATTGAVTWGAQMAAITTNTDTQDVETDALPAVTTVTTTHLGTTAKRLHRSTISLNTAALRDNLDPGDQAVVRVSRQAANAADTLVGDVVLTYVSISA